MLNEMHQYPDHDHELTLNRPIAHIKHLQRQGGEWAVNGTFPVGGWQELLPYGKDTVRSSNGAMTLGGKSAMIRDEQAHITTTPATMACNRPGADIQTVGADTSALVYDPLWYDMYNNRCLNNSCVTSTRDGDTRWDGQEQLTRECQDMLPCTLAGSRLLATFVGTSAGTGVKVNDVMQLDFLSDCQFAMRLTGSKAGLVMGSYEYVRNYDKMFANITINFNNPAKVAHLWPDGTTKFLLSVRTPMAGSLQSTIGLAEFRLTLPNLVVR